MLLFLSLMFKKKTSGESHYEEPKDHYRAGWFVSEQNKAPVPIHNTKCLEQRVASFHRQVCPSAFELSGLQTPLEDS